MDTSAHMKTVQVWPPSAPYDSADLEEWLSSTTSPVHAWETCPRADWLFWLMYRARVSNKVMAHVALDVNTSERLESTDLARRPPFSTLLREMTKEAYEACFPARRRRSDGDWLLADALMTPARFMFEKRSAHTDWDGVASLAEWLAFGVEDHAEATKRELERLAPVVRASADSLIEAEDLP